MGEQVNIGSSGTCAQSFPTGCPIPTQSRPPTTDQFICSVSTSSAYLTLPASLDCALHVHLISPLIISPPGLSPADSLLTASTSCANTRQSPKPPLRTLINHVFRSHLRRGVQTQQQERSLPYHPRQGL